MAEDQPSEDPNFKVPEAGHYDHLLDPNAPQPTSTEDAAVREPRVVTPSMEVEQQMGVAAADRKQREEKNLPPPAADLR